MKRLSKSSTNRMISGVLGGAGEYFNIDPVIIRILFVIFSFATGLFGGVIIYIIGVVIIPEGDSRWKSDVADQKEGSFDAKWTRSSAGGSRSGGLILGVIFILIGGIFLLNNLLDYNLFYYIMKLREYFWGTILVVIGVLVILLGGKKR